jgi:polyisoprenoid-binding protein YceI
MTGGAAATAADARVGARRSILRMTLTPGTHHLGPADGSLIVRTFREGVAAKVGHDLVIAVTRWEATLDGDASTLSLRADAHSLEVREGLRGVKPLTDKDRADIAKTIDEKVLRGQPIEFRSTAIHASGSGLAVEGELTLAGSTRPVSLELDVDADGRAHGTVAAAQSAWGIKPYRGLMGALKVRDEVEIAFEGQLPAGS